MTTIALREERIHMRATSRERSLLEKAAVLAGFSNLTAFIMVAARKEAERIIDHNNERALSIRDQRIVIDLLQNPPKPNVRLKKLFAQKRH